jgi:hypothetical protein
MLDIEEERDIIGNGEMEKEKSKQQQKGGIRTLPFILGQPSH